MRDLLLQVEWDRLNTGRGGLEKSLDMVILVLNKSLTTLGTFAPLCLPDYVPACAVTPTCLSGVLRIPGAPQH